MMIKARFRGLIYPYHHWRWLLLSFFCHKWALMSHNALHANLTFPICPLATAHWTSSHWKLAWQIFLPQHCSNPFLRHIPVYTPHPHSYWKSPDISFLSKESASSLRACIPFTATTVRKNTACIISPTQPTAHLSITSNDSQNHCRVWQGAWVWLPCSIRGGWVCFGARHCIHGGVVLAVGGWELFPDS